MGKSRSTQKPSLGVLFWIAAILLISIVLMFSLPSIREVLESTGFVEVVFEGAPTRDEAGPDLQPIPEERELPPPDTLRRDAPQSDEPEDSLTQDQDEADLPDREELSLVQETEPERAPKEDQRTMRITIHLIRVTDDGRIVAEAVPRTIRFTTSPLTQTLETLLNGPDADDLNRGLLSLIPTGSRLLGARVEDGVAYLSFNEDFRFNDLGLEGHLAQLQQIVLTATSFSTVDSVQILIEGRRVEYLGGDGVYVGRPLTPADFRG